MKNRIYKICGVALALVLVFSLFGAFLPVKQVEAQAYTPNQWNTMTIPSPGGLQLVPGSTIVDFAVAADGNTIYLADNSAVSLVAKSTNGGASFSWLTLPAGFAAAAGAIAVAPDNPDVAAVIEAVTGGNDVVWITTNGGATWASLGIPRATPSGTEVLSDIAVSPARTGTILGRDYVVSSYNTAAVTTPGDIYVIGTTATWAAVATTATPTALAFDFTSIALAPNWTGDRVVLGVGSNATDVGNPSAGGAGGDSYLVPINVATGAVPAPGAVLLEASGADSPSEILTGAAAEIVSSSIALPADFDSTTVGGFRAFVGWTSATNIAGDDVYRVDFNAVRKLEIRPLVGIYSVSYFGTIGSGTLMAGTAVDTAGGVWFTSDPTTSIPSWGAGSAKRPTGTTNFVVALTSATEGFATATGGDGAFSKTEDGGLSFNGLSFIDEALILIINDVMVSPDGSTVFMATEDAATPPNHSLWRGLGFPTPGYWQRVHFQAGAATVFATTGSLIRLSPDYGTDSTLYWFDLTGTRIQRSTDGGQLYGTRTGPVAGIDDAAVESADILYVIDAGGGNVYTSTNGGWFFGLPIGAGLGAIYSIAMAPSYPNTPVAGNLLVGGGAAGGIALSTNAAATFAPLLSFPAGAVSLQVYGDADYANNNIVYAAGTALAPAAGSGIWRYVVGSSTAWEDIRTGAALPAGASMSGLVQVGGALFGSWAVAGAGAPVLVAGDTFNITEPIGAAGDTGNITIVTGSAQVTAVNGTVAVDINGTAGASIVVTAGQTVSWNIPLGSTPASDYVDVEALSANTNGTWTAGLTTTVGAISVNTSGTAWATTGGPGGTFSLPAAQIPAGTGGAAASGAERTLLPTVPSYASAFWDVMDVGSTAAAFSATPSALRGASNGSSVSLWVINATAGANTLFSYNDEMALAKSTVTVPAVVLFDSVTGGNAEFTISWTNIANALKWELEICTDPGMTQRVVTTGTAYVPPAPPAPTYVVAAATLSAGADYYARVRVRDEVPADAIRSQWSEAQKFSVTAGEKVTVSYLGVQPLGPVPGAIDVPLSPGFTWSPYASSTKYEFQLANDAGFTDILAEAKLAVTGYKYDGKLSNATTYFWRARGIEPTVTDWSPVSSFTTEKAAPAPPAPPAPPPPVAPVVTPAIIWAIIAIGAILVIAVIVLILRTRRVA